MRVALATNRTRGDFCANRQFSSGVVRTFCWSEQMLNTLFRWIALLSVTLFLAACAATDTTRSTGEYADDTAITARVKLALANDDQVSALDTQVETFRGVVQLSGFADTREQAERAGMIARNVEGVKDVRNDIRIRPR